LAGQKIVPELIQKDFTVENIFIEFQKILQSESLQEKIKAHYKKIDRLLGEKMASENAARELEWLVQS
jgi:lipid A disaccharide synthetase